MSEMNRREFVVAAACMAGACLMCGAAAAEDAAPSTQPAGGKVDVGTIADYPKDGVSDKYANTGRVLIVRDNNKIYAMSAKCTHKGATVKVKGTELVCPKHGSHFTNAGKPTSGPASKGPNGGVSLFRFPISKDDAGHLWVDTSKPLGEKQWDQADASLAV
jgi:nitrite reductase/ring-hydroxylating ferredoxin subunit